MFFFFQGRLATPNTVGGKTLQVKSDLQLLHTASFSLPFAVFALFVML